MQLNLSLHLSASSPLASKAQGYVALNLQGSERPTRRTKLLDSLDCPKVLGSLGSHALVANMTAQCCDASKLIRTSRFRCLHKLQQGLDTYGSRMAPGCPSFTPLSKASLFLPGSAKTVARQAVSPASPAIVTLAQTLMLQLFELQMGFVPTKSICGHQSLRST